MVATKLLLAALAGYVAATPVASAPAAETTEWTALDIAHDAINWDGINMQAFQDPANWKQDSNETATTEQTSPNPAAAKNEVSILSGPCSQGTCPDYNAGFDLVYTFTAVPEPPDPSCPGCPPLTIFSSNSDIRVNDCKQCLRHKVGSSLGNSVPGGCYNFKTCGRDQVICVDPGKSRAHRIWKDKGHKTCYKMKAEYLGGCGFVKSRIVVHPTGETACNW
ncbi:hypothetical protein ISF_03868 [Cordyceps fumosorosea ARSEF 2679]|uniref:Uncharacterized protein n=1 Tax=Cordyceps fumosorosea (strain ARSEF 2679) TaxID=1081104 RepID=A0A162MS42_CORFA|nr:hypothetical protein ISF_03868 [Cordyceps fumosorosea ARSEF 2679]OAA66030.1 hypothetical protein ISF_03868 [Cordyceps fumosorosea ARSEF 2679]